MDVACSTFCFDGEPLERALRHIAELEFARVDLGISEQSNHARPAEVLADPNLVIGKIRQGPTIGIAGVTLRMNAPADVFLEHLAATAHLAKQLSCAVITIEAASADMPIEQEAARLTQIVKAASLHGVVACVLTKSGTLAQTPAGAVLLCQRVPGLGLTLDPSYFIVGPHQGDAWDEVYPFVRHVHLRDTGKGPNQFQVPVGRGEIDYSKIVTALTRTKYRGTLVVAIEEGVNPELNVEAEVRKLARVLESVT